MHHFRLEGQYKELLAHYGLDAGTVLRKAQLPEDILNHKTIVMKEAEYYRFLTAIGALADDPALPVKMAREVQLESFSPPLFAAYCSPNGIVCLKRLAHYKRLIGPMAFEVTLPTAHEAEGARTVTVTLQAGESGLSLPPFLVQSEFAFLLALLRRATQEEIRPLSMMLRAVPESPALAEFAGVVPQAGPVDAITFAEASLLQPFVSRNEAMWSYFEPELSRRLADLAVDSSISARVRSALTELLPSGIIGIEAVAEKLGLSRRTLQRKLAEEGTTFQKQLNSTREVLALHYVRHTAMTSNDIAYLLGYAELNSFLRAFKIWTGRTISEYRRQSPAGDA